MPFNSKTGKIAGKKSSRKGIPDNVETKELKQFFRSLLTENTERIRKEFLALKGKDFVNATFKVAEFSIPKQRQVEQVIDLSKLTEEQINDLFDRALNSIPDEEE